MFTLGSFIILLGYFIAYAVLLWYATCTKHKRIPKILSVLYFFLCMIPVAIYFVCSIWVWVYWEEYDYDIELKNNWFNRTFLAYNAE
jgi:predicted PurR-regulated permease PerM